MNAKRYSDFAEEAKPLDGTKIKIEEILNKEISVIGYVIRRSKYEKNRSGRCLCLQIEINNDRHVIFTGSDVLIEQIEKYGSQVPFFCTIRKVDRFYTFS